MTLAAAPATMARRMMNVLPGLSSMPTASLSGVMVAAAILAPVTARDASLAVVTFRSLILSVSTASVASLAAVAFQIFDLERLDSVGR